jgi:hypothetical protein
VLLASPWSDVAEARVFHRTLYAGSGVVLRLDPTGAVSTLVGADYHPQYFWLDRSGRTVTPALSSIVEARARAPRR